MSAASSGSAGAKGAVAVVLLGALAVAVFVPLMGGAAAGSESTAIDANLTAMITDATGACVVAGPVWNLDSEQAAVAGEVVSAAFASSGENLQATRIALMVAWTESSLRDLGPMPGNDGSLGLFQQRGWGTPQQEMDPATATALFIDRLLALPRWDQLPPWVAAQAVQRSKFADGSNYQANWDSAGAILDSVVSDGNQPSSCGQGVPSAIAGPASAHGLPPGYSIPPDTPPAHTAVVTWALDQLGKPYVWAAAGPGAFDCSGLTMAAWGTVGVRLDHYTVAQQTEGAPVTASSLLPGDLVLIPGSDAPAPGEAGHVGVYLGDGLVESAIDPQSGVAVQSWSTFTSGGLIALRDPDPADG